METATLTPTRTHRDQLQPPPADLAYLTTVMVNVAFVGQPYADLADWALVDAGLPFNAGRIAAFAHERFGPVPPRAIILTHGHFDHVGSLDALLRRWPGTPVYAHELEMPFLTGRSAYPPPDPTVGGGLMARLSPLFPRHPHDFRPRVRSLPRDGSVPFMPGWQWIHTPGHSPGHVSFFRESDRALIAGDAFVTQKQESLSGALTHEYVVHGPPAYFTIDWAAARESVRRLDALRPNYAITGHGLPVSNPRLAHDLHLLATHFDEIAMPPDGRYVRQPAVADERGVVYVPPPIPDVRPKLIAALALGAVGLAVARTSMRYRDGD